MNRNVGWIGLLLIGILLLVSGWIAFSGGIKWKTESVQEEPEIIPKVKHTKRIKSQNFVARKAVASEVFDPTHRQVDVFYPSYEGLPIVLQTFCLGPSGNIWACVGGPYLILTPEEEFIKLKQEAPPMIQVYSPELKLVQQIDLPFTPTAINFDSELQSFFVGGQGRLAQLDVNGKVLLDALAPNMQHTDELKRQVRAQMEKDLAETRNMRIGQIEKLETRLKPLEDKLASGKDLTSREHTQLKSFRRLYRDATEHLKTIKTKRIEDHEVDDVIRDRMAIKSIAVANDFLFIGVLAEDNYSYEVFRVNKQFKEPQKILGYMRGCCGQFDIKASGNSLWVADNTKFRVVKFDANGNRLDAFGHGDREQQHAFGSCCNPMNLRVLESGDLLTAESSVGHIKRYSPEGKLLEYIGQASVANGCKNVSLGFDAKRNIYYMLHQDEHAICILRPTR